MFDGTFLRNNRKQKEQQTKPVPYRISMLQTCLRNVYPVRSSGKSSSRSGGSLPRTNLTREKSSEVPVVVGPSEGRYPSALFFCLVSFSFL